MKCYVSKYAGLCYGATRAVEAAYQILKQKDKLWMYGEVVHNPIVMKKLISYGCKVTDDVEEIPKDSLVLIRAHGVPSSIIDKLSSKNTKIIDKTCLKVKTIHDIVNKAYPPKTKILIFGNPIHPEVEGIYGWCSSEPLVIANKEEYLIYADELQKYDKLVAVFQTTYDIYSYNEMKDILLKNHPDMEIHNTICPDVHLRQKEVSRVSKKCDLVIIIGGKNSSNTAKLYHIASKHCETIHIENAEEFDSNCIGTHKYIGIFNGASTPLISIQEIVKKLKVMDKQVELCNYNF